MTPTCLQFFSALRWLDGRPLMDTIEPYRRELFTQALDTYEGGRPKYNLVLAGRGKKNNKSLDLTLAALFCLVIRRSIQGSDAYILASDEDQAADDLQLARKLVACNPDLAAEIEVFSKELRLRDGSASLRILPARDVAGMHGKSAAFVGFDEIHTQRNWDLLEALQPDPSRDTLTWITSYDGLYDNLGVPLHDLKKLGRSGADPRMLFQWYSGDFTTDPAFAELPPELRANPSLTSWPGDGLAYLEQQKRRLPTSKYRRLHLNLPGAPAGAFFDQGIVLSAIVAGRRSLPPDARWRYCAFVDMSGGSSDDAVLAVAHAEGRRVVIDLVEKQASGTIPFNPRSAVRKFAQLLKLYGLARVTGDAYAGQTFRQDFAEHGVDYLVSRSNKSDLYESLEPLLNAGEVELLDLPILQEQLLCLVTRGTKVDHEPGGHDDWANSCAGVAALVAGWTKPEQPPFWALIGNWDDAFSGMRRWRQEQAGVLGEPGDTRLQREARHWSPPCLLQFGPEPGPVYSGVRSSTRTK